MRVRTKWVTVLIVALCFTAGLALVQTGAQTAVKTDSPVLDRTALPVPEPVYPPITELDARKAKAPPRFEAKAPKGAHSVAPLAEILQLNVRHDSRQAKLRVEESK